MAFEAECHSEVAALTASSGAISLSTRAGANDTNEGDESETVSMLEAETDDNDDESA
jgi:hypothetical protein